MKNKKLNKALCSVISVFLATNNLAFATNQSSAQTHSLPQKIVKKVKNNKIAAGTLILGTGLVIAGTIGFILGDDEKIDINEILNSIKNKDEQEVITKIQADEWFERLGGYKNKYIDEYKKKYENFDVKATNTLNDQQNKNYKTIEKDVPRTESSFSENQKDMCLQILEKILKINVCEGTDYAQGFNDIAAMVINKFLRYSDHDYTIEDEVKIYYVYKTIVRTVSDNFEKINFELAKDILNTKNSNDLTQIYSTLPLEILATACTRFNLKLAIKIWDAIILNDKIYSNGEFDSKKAFEQIVCITKQTVLKFLEHDDVKNLSELRKNFYNYFNN